MRITNMLHFTENHRFCVFRDFSLGGLDYRMLTSVYQPMIGAAAAAVYLTLCEQLDGGRSGYSETDQQRKLFLSLGLEPGERGRSFFIEQTSKLEAVGLLQTTRRFIPAQEDYMYEYELHHPLGPSEFFKNQHLALLLRDKVGKYRALSLVEELVAKEPAGFADSNAENISIPFYELFRLNTQSIDYDLEKAIDSAGGGRRSEMKPDISAKGFEYAEIIMRFPRDSRNRLYVEELKVRKDQLAAINFIAGKFALTLQETCRLLDEDGIFDEEGELLQDLLNYNAGLYFRQSKQRDEKVERHIHKVVPMRHDESDGLQEKAVEYEFYLEVPVIFQGQCDIHQYNMYLRNDPYTKVLKRFFSQGSVPDGVLDIFQKIDVNYKLNEEVINVLIHYIHTDRRSWAKSSIEAVAADLLGKQVATYEQAVDYIREKAKYKEQVAARASGEKSGGVRKGRQKPKIPIITDVKAGTPVTQEELDDMRRLAQKLDGKV